MNVQRAVGLQGLHVLRRAIAFVAVKAIGGMLLVQLDQQAVARDFGENGRG